ncbi:MAG: protein-disulfide reductase DsbD domain-containing protein [Pseudomonadota bacterium]
MVRKLVVPALLLTLLLALTAGPARAAEEPPTLTARVLHSLNAYAPGGPYPLIVELTIRPGYHINDQRPAEPDLFPTTLTWPASPDISFGPAVFPAPRKYKPSFASQPMEVHDGRVLVRATLQVAKTAAPGARELKAKLVFQACDDQSCLMPETLEVPLTVTVAPAGKPGQALNQELFKK